jgi:hypothetical protein
MTTTVDVQKRSYSGPIAAADQWDRVFAAE